jgi:hypothetical protein
MHGAGRGCMECHAGMKVILSVTKRRQASGCRMPQATAQKTYTIYNTQQSNCQQAATQPLQH